MDAVVKILDPEGTVQGTVVVSMPKNGSARGDFSGTFAIVGTDHVVAVAHAVDVAIGCGKVVDRQNVFPADFEAGLDVAEVNPPFDGAGEAVAQTLVVEAQIIPGPRRAQAMQHSKAVKGSR